MDAVDMSFQDCIIKKISDVILNDGSQQVIDVVPEMLDKCEQEYLWTYFARTRFTDKDGHVLFPVIVLDLFEEVLRTRREETEILLRQIHYLMDEIFFVPLRTRFQKYELQQSKNNQTI